MIITKKSLPRRDVPARSRRHAGAAAARLDGAGAVAAAQGAPAKPPVRLGFVYTPNGIIGAWTRARARSCGRRSTAGANFEFSPTMKALEPFREHLNVFSGLAQVTGPGARRRRGRPRARDRDLPDRRPSEQDRRRRISRSASPPIRSRRGNSASTRSCRRSSSVSSRSRSPATATPATPARTCRCRGAVRPQPAAGGNQPARRVRAAVRRRREHRSARSRLARLEEQKSVLDYVVRQPRRGCSGASAPATSASSTNTSKRSATSSGASSGPRSRAPTMELPHMERPSAVPDDYEQYAKLMIDMQVIALQTDMTRVISFMLGRDGSNRPYREIGISDGHHSISHHQNDRRAGRQADQDRRAPRRDVRVSAEEAEGDARRRRHAARSLPGCSSAAASANRTSTRTTTCRSCWPAAPTDS